jgi:hypothetical protein
MSNSISVLFNIWRAVAPLQNFCNLDNHFNNFHSRLVIIILDIFKFYSRLVIIILDIFKFYSIWVIIILDIFKFNSRWVIIILDIF